MHQKHIVRIIAAVAVTTLAAGCGGGSGDSSSDKNLKIGMSSILSGSAASSGVGMDCGIKAYLDAKNRAGGVNGYTFSYEEKDNQYDPAKAATIARGFANDGVFAVATVGTAPMRAAIPALQPRNIPLFALADGSLLAPPAKGVFGVGPEYSREAASGAKFILDELNMKKAGLVYLNSEAGTPAAEAFPTYFKGHGGEVVSSQAVATTVNDFTPFAQKLKQSGAPVVYAFVVDTQLAGLQKASAAIGFTPKWVAWSPAFTPSYLELAGQLSQDAYVSQFTTPNSQTDDPNMKEYLAGVAQTCPKDIASVSVKRGWTVAAAIALGVEKATTGGKKLTPDTFLQALHINGEPVGVIPSVTYNDTSHAGVATNAYYQIEAGKLKPVTPFTELPLP